MPSSIALALWHKGSGPVVNGAIAGAYLLGTWIILALEYDVMASLHCASCHSV